MKNRPSWISLLAALLLGASAQAEMITLGGDQTAGTGTLTVNSNLVFTLTGKATQLAFIFDEVVTSDGSNDYVPFSGLEYSINGGSRKAVTTWLDNFTQSFGDITPNDGLIYGHAVGVSSGDTVTLHAGTGTMTSTAPTFNPWTSGDYDVFIADGNGVQISDVVPEPATMGLLAILGLIVAGYRRFFVL